MELQAPIFLKLKSFRSSPLNFGPRAGCASWGGGAAAKFCPTDCVTARAVRRERSRPVADDALMSWHWQDRPAVWACSKREQAEGRRKRNTVETFVQYGCDWPGCPVNEGRGGRPRAGANQHNMLPVPCHCGWPVLLPVKWRKRKQA